MITSEITIDALSDMYLQKISDQKELTRPDLPTVPMIDLGFYDFHNLNFIG